MIRHQIPNVSRHDAQQYVREPEHGKITQADDWSSTERYCRTDDDK